MVEKDRSERREQSIKQAKIADNNEKNDDNNERNKEENDDEEEEEEDEEDEEERLMDKKVEKEVEGSSMVYSRIHGYRINMDPGPDSKSMYKRVLGGLTQTQVSGERVCVCVCVCVRERVRVCV